MAQPLSNDGMHIYTPLSISFSVEMVELDLPPTIVTQPETSQTITSRSFGKSGACQKEQILRTRFDRSVMVFLDSLKNQHQHALILQARDSQRIEQCKSKQRKYIANFRQRENGKFCAEKETSKPKIRAPESFKFE